ncbi:hypothetical protein EDM56_04330 [Brevibacillus fluminis]|uniref:Uncharacterized protein n=1 Tax=Brevibacillus fluminis TaxID=511487 RepID=A0A3M8DV65_9BACL|nr:hypothetical protein [Brevibacillus fluminis]RNB91986.1 hypothetical protein EDM56_04330 [Brevibacillus fluminis]
MTYAKTNWQDRLFIPDTGEVLQEGTKVTAARMNNIEEGIFVMHSQFDQLQRQILRLQAYSDANNRVVGNNGTFVDTFDGMKDVNLKLDMTRTTLVSHTSTVLTVENTVGFIVGQEITIASLTAYENRVINAINGKTITLTSGLTGTYPAGAIVARSTVEIDTTNKKMKRGSYKTYDVTISVS